MIKKNKTINTKKSQLQDIFLKACAIGDLNTIKLLLKDENYHLDLTLFNENSQNGLIIACFNNQLETMNYLLTSTDLVKKFNVNKKDNEKNTLLMYASYNGYLKIIKYLLTNPDFNININSKNKIGKTALMFACEKNNIEVIKYLLTSSDLKEHANMYETDNNGYNLLMHSLAKKTKEISNFLIIDMNMEINNDLLKNLEKFEYSSDFLELIKTRNNFNKLNKIIISSEINERKIKI